MDMEKREWEGLLREAKTEAPAIISTMALTIFPPVVSPEQTPRRIAAGALRNLLAYIVRLAVQHYLVRNPEELPAEMSEFLSKLSAWLRKDSNVRLFMERRTRPLTEQETQTVFRETETFPAPPGRSLSRMRYAYAVLPDLLELRNAASPEGFAVLYRIAGDWNEALSRPAMQLFPSRKPLEFARMHVNRNIRRIDCHTARSIVWGKELHESFMKYLEMGLHPRTAKAKTRKDFIAAHPVPKNDEELLGDDSFPGHSRPAILRYMKKYLDSLQGEDDF